MTGNMKRARNDFIDVCRRTARNVNKNQPVTKEKTPAEKSISVVQINLSAMVMMPAAMVSMMPMMVEYRTTDNRTG